MVSFLQPSFRDPDRCIKIGNLGKVSGLLCQVWSAAGQQVIMKAVVCTCMTVKDLVPLDIQLSVLNRLGKYCL